MAIRAALTTAACLGVMMPAALTGAQTKSETTSGMSNGPIVQTWRRPGPVMHAPPGAPWLVGRGDPTAMFLSVDEDPEGDMPREVAYAPDGSEIVVVQRDTDNVTFFDVDTRLPIATLAVGDFPVDVAVTPDGQYALVPNVLDNTVTMIDVFEHAVVETIPVTGEQPYSVAITPDGLLAVVGVITDGSTSRFSILDLTTKTELRSFPTTDQGVIGFFFTPETGGFGNIFTQSVLVPDGGTILLGDRANSVVTLYDLEGTVLETLAVADLPTAIDVSDDGTVAVVSHEGSARTITKIDLVNQVVDDAFTTAENLSNQSIRITPDKSHAIAAISNNVIFVNLTTGATTQTIMTGSVGEIEISFDGQYAFVSNFNARVIDIASQMLVDTIPFAPCAEAATSPTELRAVALNNRFRENIHFYNINGAAGFLEGSTKAGEPNEGDGCFGADISPDGAVAVVCNVVSENVAIIDMLTKTVRSYVEVGDRPKEVRITPDGAYAVVCAMDANQVVIIDLATDTAVASLPIFNRPGRVRISPDSQFAYVLNVAGTDRITFIALDGEDSSIIEQLPAGQTGSANGYAYTEVSGIELSPDGSILVCCDSFNDLLRIYDTATRTQIDAIAVGDFPIRAGFAPDGDTVYVTNAFGDSVSVVRNNGLTWQNIGAIPNIDFPLTVDVDAANEYVYVGNAGNSPGVRVIDTDTLNVVRTVLFPEGSPRDSYLSDEDGLLYNGSTNAEMVVIEAAGADSAIVQTIPLAAGPSDLAFNQARKTSLTTYPGPDGVDIIPFGVPGDLNGDGVVNVLDLLILLDEWGPCPACDSDLNGDGVVNVLDLLILLSNWG
jgi:YVTN family beta-propeller protein